MADEEKTAKEKALDSVPSDRRVDLAERVAQMGGQNHNDITWYIIQNVINAEAAADRAASAAEAVGESVGDLSRSLAQVPEQSTQAVLKAGEHAASDVQKSLESFAQEHADAMKQALRQVIQQEYDKGEESRRQNWSRMLDAFDEKAAEIAEKHKQKIEKDLTKSVDKLSRRDAVWSFVLAILFGIIIAGCAGFGAIYIWTAYRPPVQTIESTLSHCSTDTNGSLWCRVTPPKRSDGG